MGEHLQNELNRLRNEVMELGDTVVANIGDSVDALMAQDDEKARTVMHCEHRVDFAEVRIEEECLKIIALHQPVADNLRFLATVIRANHELERISDLAAAIARTGMRVAPADIEPYGEGLLSMRRLVREMTREGLEALLAQDSDAAWGIWRKDKQVDELRDVLVAAIRGDITEREANAAALFDLLDVAHRLERAGDHAANIGKAVLYLVLGRIVRHRGREFRKKGKDEKVRVLFVCVHNSARSQMAAAWLNKLHGDRYEAESAGLTPGELNPLAVRVMQECDVDISRNTPKDIAAVANREPGFDYVITVCDAANAERCPPVLGIAEQLQWEFDDPSAFTGDEEDRLQKTRRVRDAIRMRIEEWVSPAEAVGEA